MDIVRSVLKQPSKEKASAELEKVNLTLVETEIARLIYFDGLTIEKVAEIRGVSVSTINRCKNRVDRKCRVVFDETNMTIN